MRSVRPGAKLVLTLLDDEAKFATYDKPDTGPRGAKKEEFPVPADARIVISALDASAEIRWTGGPRTVTLNDGECAIVSSNAALCVDLWECTCGCRGCGEEHRLAEWDPSIRLPSYLASAVKGLNEIKTKSFADGVYYGLLSEEDFDV